MDDRKPGKRPAEPNPRDRTYPEGMEKERRQPEHDQTTRPSQRKDGARIDAPTTSRQPRHHGTDAPGAASGDPTE